MNPNILVFNCPECGSDKLLELVGDAAVYSRVVSLDEKKRAINYKQEPSDIMACNTEAFECGECRYVIRDEAGDNITDFDALVEFLKKHAKVVELKTAKK